MFLYSWLEIRRDNGTDPAFREVNDECITGIVHQPGSLSQRTWCLLTGLLWLWSSSLTETIKSFIFNL